MTAPRHLPKDSILVWQVSAQGLMTAGERAAYMGAIADEFQLGGWNIAEIGINGQSVYFDLTLSRSARLRWIKVLFGSEPTVY